MLWSFDVVHKQQADMKLGGGTQSANTTDQPTTAAMQQQLQIKAEGASSEGSSTQPHELAGLMPSRHSSVAAKYVQYAASARWLPVQSAQQPATVHDDVSEHDSRLTAPPQPSCSLQQWHIPCSSAWQTRGSNLMPGKP